MSTIKGKDKKERKPRSEAQLAATARLVKLNKERAVLRSQGKLPPVQRKKKTKATIKESKVDPPVLDLDEDYEASVSSVSSMSSDDEEYNYHFDNSAKDPEHNTEPEPEPEPEPKPVKPKRKRRVYK